jgi:hypothetical protein
MYCIHCSTLIKGNEYWWKKYRIPVHTYCVGMLSEGAYNRDFLSNLPHWIQDTVRVSRNSGEIAMQVSET